jgi:hypothetical protein
MTKLSRIGWWALCVVLFSSCHPSTFLIGKDGSYAYFGRGRPHLYQELCVRDELRSILSESGLPDDMKGDFYEYACSEQRSYDKVVSLYLFLTPEEKERLKASFVKHGYEVNHVNC